MRLSMKKWHCDHRFQREKLPRYENLHEFPDLPRLILKKSVFKRRALISTPVATVPMEIPSQFFYQVVDQR